MDEPTQNFFTFLDVVINGCVIGLFVVFADWLIFGPRVEEQDDGDE